MSILVVMEHHEGKLHKMSWEALAAGQTVAVKFGLELQVLVLGSEVGLLAAELAVHRVSQVLVAEHTLLADFSADGYTLAIQQVVEKVDPFLVLFPHTYLVRDYGPKLATRMKRPFLSGAIEIRSEKGRIKFVRQLFQGKINVDVVLTEDPPNFVSIQSGSYRGDALQCTESLAPIEIIKIMLDSNDIRARYGKWFREAKSSVDLSSTKIIVSVGRGIKDPENIPIVGALAKALGGEIAASRPVCDNGWLPLERQVGSSGQTVSPKLYLAVGISGAIQHVVGMKGSKTIVAVNQDSGAPIFEISDYGIVGDLFAVVPFLTEAVLAAQDD